MDQPADASAQKLRVFLSYSRRDSGFVQRLAEALEARGYLPDFDRSTHDKDNVTTGISAEDDWWKRLQEMIEAADAMVFVVSPDSAASKVCDEEIAYARSLGKRVIPLLRREIDFAAAPPRLAALNVKIGITGDDLVAFDGGVTALSAALDRDVAWLREQTRLILAAGDWERSGRRDEELLHGAEISEAEAWSARRPAATPEVSEQVLAFLAESRRAQTAREEKERRSLRRQRGLQRLVGGLIVVALAITAVGGWYVIERQRSVARSESLVLARVASQKLAQNDYAGALRLAVLAGRDTFLAPASEEAEAMLAATATASPLVADLAGHQGDIAGAVFSPDEKQVLSWGADRTVRIWNVEAGVAVASIPHEGAVTSAQFFDRGGRVLTTDEAGNVRMFSAADGAESGPAIKLESAVYGATFSPDESVVLLREGVRPSRLVMRKTADGAAVGEPFAFEGIGRGAQFSRDGKRFLMWSEGGAQIRDTGSGAVLTGGMELPQGMAGAAFSPDETNVLGWSGPMSQGNAAQLWDAATGQPIGRPMQHFGAVTHAGFVDEGRRVLTQSADATARLWEASTGAPVGEPLSHNAPVNPDAPPDIWLQLTRGVYDADVDEPGGRIATVGSDMRVRFWDMTTGAPLQPALTLPSSARSVKFVADGARVATLDEAGVVRVWNLANGQQLGPDIPTEAGLARIVFSKDRTRILTWGNGGALRVSTLGANVAPTPWMQHNGIVRGADLLPGGQQIMSWGDDGAVRFWNAQTREPIGDALQHDARVLGASVSPDGKRVLSWSFDGTARQWDLATHQQIGPPLKGEGVLLSAVWLRGGQRIATMSEDRTARLWDAATGQRIGKDMKHDKPDVADFSVAQPLFYEILDYYDVVPSPDGTRLLTFANAFEARLWDEESGAPTGKPMVHESLVNGAVFSHDGVMIATWSGQSIIAGQDNSARLWSSATTEPIGERMMQTGAVRGAAFSADDKQLVTWTNEGEVQLWDTATAASVGPVMKHEGFVVGAAFSPDGKLAVSWGSDGMVKFWDVTTGEQSGRSLRHSGSVQSAEFYAGGRYLLTTDMTNSVRPQVRVWDVSLRREVMTLGIGAGLTLGAKWVEGDRLLTWGEGNAVQMWPADWFRPRHDLATFAKDVCDRKLRSTAVELDTVDGRMWVGARRITAADVDQTPVLSGREGEDVCGWAPQWYDRALDAVLGWMRLAP